MGAHVGELALEGEDARPALGAAVLPLPLPLHEQLVCLVQLLLELLDGDVGAAGRLL